MKLNLGCGSQVVAGWTNVDWVPGARLAKLPLFKAINRKLRFFRADWHKDIVLHDLTRPFPWPEESVDVVYSSHTLEHPSKEEGLKFLKECHRVLRRGGIIRILVPDLAASCSGTIPASCAENFVAELGVLYHSSLRGLRGKLFFMVQFPHKCMYDTPALIGARAAPASTPGAEARWRAISRRSRRSRFPAAPRRR